MSRYIDAEALEKRRIDYIVDGYADSVDDMVEWGMAIIEAPSIDLADYVPKEFHDKTCEAMAKRHKECKHNYNTVINHGKMKPRCDFTDRVLTENDFCSRGEREGE